MKMLQQYEIFDMNIYLREDVSVKLLNREVASCQKLRLKRV